MIRLPCKLETFAHYMDLKILMQLSILNKKFLTLKHHFNLSQIWLIDADSLILLIIAKNKLFLPSLAFLPSCLQVHILRCSFYRASLR